MKLKLLLLSLLAFIIAFAIYSFSNSVPGIHLANSSSIENKKKNFTGCSPDWALVNDWLEDVDIPIMPGAGNHKWKISTKNDSAQLYFNQGMNMYYSFHIIEAMASFKKAAKFDPGCAMLFWAQSLTLGPNINDYGYRASPEALAAINKAIEVARTNSPVEKGLIHAMSVRYSADSSKTREELNQDYTDKMKKLFEENPGHPDLQALYIDAMMLQHPWDLWYNNGKPKPWTPRIRELLEKMLVKYPNHPGANHYYIHVMEPSPFAAKALPSADRLGKLTPGLSHTVHMPSHIYLRTGNYNKGTQVNENAVNSYSKYKTIFPAVQGNSFLYLNHNQHMQTNCGMMAGRYDYSMYSAGETRKGIDTSYMSYDPPFGAYFQYMYMIGTLVNTRFGKWDELLKAEVPAKHHIYANILHHFGKGMALANLGKTGEASKELQSLRSLLNDSSLYIAPTPFSSASEGALIARDILSGAIALKENNKTDAIRLFSEAVMREENMTYNEPKDWLLNPKPYLADAYFEFKQWAEAEKMYMKDLAFNNENVWSLSGLRKTLLAQKKNAQEKIVLIRLKKAGALSDVNLY